MAVGTDSRLGVWVRGVCARCADTDVLVYEATSEGGETELLCADDFRVWIAAHPRKQACDKCSDTGNVWRDPIPRKNEYLCINCHDPETLFQNRWANRVRESIPLGLRERPQCDARGRGTDCKGEVKYRSAHRMSLCNKHAGRTGVGPDG